MIKKLLIAMSLFSLGINNLIAADEPAAQTQAIPVKVFKIVQGEHYTSRTYPTILKSIDKVDVIARVKGFLEEKYFKEGDFVKKGQLLYLIEPDTYLANLNMAKAQYVKAEKDYVRAKALIATKSISDQSFDDYTYQYNSTKAALDEAQIQYNYTKVVSPIDGIAGIKRNDIGDLVGSDSSNSLLVSVTSVDPIHAEFSLPKDDRNNYFTQIKDKKVKVNLISNGKTYEGGVIDYISPDIDTTTDTLLLRAKFDNKNDELLVGNFSQIEIANIYLGKVDVVPEIAVSRSAKGAFVYVVDENMTAQVRSVEAGDLVKEGIIIKSGLKDGDNIIISNMAKLAPSVKVQIIDDKDSGK